MYIYAGYYMMTLPKMSFLALFVTLDKAVFSIGISFATILV